MNTINIILMVVLASLISLIVGFSAGKSAGKSELIGQFKSLMDMGTKMMKNPAPPHDGSSEQKD